MATSATALLLALTGGCTHSSQEQGLFHPPSTPASSDAPSPAPTSEPPRPKPLSAANPALPVAGQAVWTTGEGLEITVRFAVHAIRRSMGATVLDWSVTPLSGRGLHRGDVLPTTTDLALLRGDLGGVNVLLLDPAAGRVYRPLSTIGGDGSATCLCTPAWTVDGTLRVGETRLLQIAYPRLPTSVRFLDVDVATLPPFAHVPVSPTGRVPTAPRPVDLSRPAEELPALSAPVRVPDPDTPGRSPQTLMLDQVVVTGHRTSLQWTIRSVAGQPNYGLPDYGAPVPFSPPSYVPAPLAGTASAPRIAVAGAARSTALKVQLLSMPGQNRRARECLCTSFGAWTEALRHPGGAITVATNFPALPRGTRRVDVILPGVGTVRDLPVTAAVDGADLVGPEVAASVRTWTVSPAALGWAPRQWPTPLPSPAQLPRYKATVDRLH